MPVRSFVRPFVVVFLVVLLGSQVVLFRHPTSKLWPFFFIDVYSEPHEEMVAGALEFSLLDSRGQEVPLVGSGFFVFKELVCLEGHLARALVDLERSPEFLEVAEIVRTRTSPAGYRGLRLYESRWQLITGTQIQRELKAEKLW